MSSPLTIFLIFVAVVLGISFWLGSKAKSAKGYYAAHGEIPWFVNGIAFAGDYLSAASFLGICGLIATGGYDGFLYSIGFLAGWVVALFVVAEPIKRLGRFTFADALDSQFDSRGIKLAAAISTLVVSIFYLIPQMVGAGAVMTSLLGWQHVWGVVAVGVVVTIIVATAGMVSTTWVQFIKGSVLVLLCTILSALILHRGLSTSPPGSAQRPFKPFVSTSVDTVAPDTGTMVIAEDGGWVGKPFVRVVDGPATGGMTVWRRNGDRLSECQTVVVSADKKTTTVNGVVLAPGVKAKEVLRPGGNISALPGGRSETGSLSPAAFLTTIQDSEINLWGSDKIKNADGSEITVYFQRPSSGEKIMQPGFGLFKGMSDPDHKTVGAGLYKDMEVSTVKKLDFISLMIALFCGTASLPHILIRYYTVRDQAAARKSTVVGIATIGFFYVLTLIIGLGAMTSGVLDVTDPTLSAPLLARSFGDLLFALIAAVAFTTILGTVSGLILAASGAVAHDLMTNVMKMAMDDHHKVMAGKVVAIIVGIIAMVLGVVFEAMNPSFLVGWAFSIAASANLPSLIMLLFWKRTTRQGITWAVVVGMISSLTWILVSADTYKKVYGWPEADALVPFSQPGLVTIPLGFLVLIVVSLMTRGSARPPIPAPAG
ncbi:MAG: cation acetate symporter [Planctomycetes bacterium]|nr:cation acetate symporter [Planctomycetota bacterium]